MSDKIVWVSGSGGTVLKTINSGKTWTSVGPSLSVNDTALEFRDVQAFSSHQAVILSIGEGTDSRVYVTKDGGKTWKLSFQNQEPTAFYDCLAFENQRHGMAVSDPVNGKFRLIETFDGGETWNIVDDTFMPPALPGEFAFSASGTCIDFKSGKWYLAAGGVDPGRIFRSLDDKGRKWEVIDTPITGSAAGGVFSVRFHDSKNGIALGGDFEKPTGALNNAAFSSDGGKSWEGAKSFPGGYRSGGDWIGGLTAAAVAVGPTGSDFSWDGGRNWKAFDNGSFDAVECVDWYVCWASGAKGRVARLGLEW